jgi:hypothetical protein
LFKRVVVAGAFEYDKFSQPTLKKPLMVTLDAWARATPGAARAPATATASNFLFINYFSLEILTWRKEHQICSAPRASLDFSVVRKLLRFCQSASGKTRKNGASGGKTG